jgi:uncharacterized delta-60 repeat protein
MKMRTLLFALLIGISWHAVAQPGKLDPSFGVFGIVVSPNVSVYKYVAVQPSGKIIVVSDEGSNELDYLIRFNADGTIDNTFGVSGKKFVSYINDEDETVSVNVTGMGIQADGKILVCGKDVVLRFGVDGVLDNTYGNDGAALVEVSGYSISLNDLEIDKSGRAVVVGSAKFEELERLVMARFTTGGAPDTDFNNGGVRIIVVGDGLDYVGLSVGIDPSNNIIVGYSKGPQNVNAHQGIINRYTASGALDQTLGSLPTSYPSGSISVSNDKWIHTGNQLTIREFDASVLYNLQGSPTGITVPYIGISSTGVQADNKLLGLGIIEFSVNDYSKVWVRRFKQDGTVDGDFGTNGVTTTDLLYRAHPFATVAHGNRIYVAGDIQLPSFAKFGFLLAYDATDFLLKCPSTTWPYETDDGKCYATINGLDPIGYSTGLPGTLEYKIENGSSAVFGTGSVSGKQFLKGTTKVTYYYKDVTEQTCEFTITVIDKQSPSITCPVALNLPSDPGVCSATVSLASLGIPTVSDNCPGVTYTTPEMPPGNVFTKGTTILTWIATDASGNTSSCTQSVTIEDRQPPVISDVSTDYPVLAPPNRKMRLVNVSYNSSDNCGVTTTLSVSSNEPETGLTNGDQGPDMEVIDNYSVRLRAERDPRGEGRIYTITIKAVDEAGNSSTETTQVIVAHNIALPRSGASFKVGSTVNLTGVFWDVAGNKHTAKWIIDDKTVVKASVTEPSGMKNGKVTGSYKFATPGVYKIQMVITDQKGVSTTTTTSGDLEAIIVIYDPSGGYTYGGGYFASPVGALPSDRSAQGNVSFGFQSNYYKTATYPKGETQFEFKTGELEFNALNFDYLVVNGAMAQFKGVGKIVGGQSGVGFLMTVIDGDLDGSGKDKIRMKIYNRNTGIVYYDNQPGASDAALPITEVGLNSVILIQGAGQTTHAGRDDLLTEKSSPDSPVINKLIAEAFPNPTANYFSIIVRSNSSKVPINIQIIDQHGRVIESKNGVMTGKVTTIGHNYQQGVYYARVIQGGEISILKLIKIE